MRVQNLSVKFALDKRFFGKPKHYFHALANINLDVVKGQTLGIVGESGSGKSTLAMAMLRLQSCEGSIALYDDELQGLQQKALRPYRRKMQVVFQDPFASLSPRMTVQEIIAEGLVVHTQFTSEEIELKVIRTMEDVGLDRDIRHRYPHEFSGGQRQRVAIARALILNPEIIFLDEPTSALDRAVQVQVIALLRDLQQRYQLTYVFISHDLKVIKSLSHQVVVMQAGRIVEKGTVEEVFSHPQAAYTRELLNAALN